MFQREVAERLVAAPRSPAYGRLSVLVQWLTEPKILFDLPPRAFVPPPKVTSSVVILVPRAAPLAAGLETDPRTDDRRRLRPAPQDAAIQPEDARRSGRTLLAAAGIPPTARAEELSVADFCGWRGRWTTGTRTRDHPPRSRLTNSARPI